MGETGDSGHDLGLDEIAKLRGLLPFWHVLPGCDRGDLPDSRLGLIIADFPFYPLSRNMVLRRGAFDTIWVFFSTTRFLSEPDLRWFL